MSTTYTFICTDNVEVTYPAERVKAMPGLVGIIAKRTSEDKIPIQFSSDVFKQVMALSNPGHEPCCQKPNWHFSNHSNVT